MVSFGTFLSPLALVEWSPRLLQRSSSGRKKATSPLLSKAVRFSLRATHDNAERRQEESSLLVLDKAVLSYPSTSPDGSSTSPPRRHGPWSLTIASPQANGKGGGHALLGRNGTGKSLLSQALIHHGGSPDFVKSGTLTTAQPWHSNAIAYVSFESHEAVVTKGGSVYQTVADGGNLTKAAQFLVVRFGLFPLLHRDVRTLSTGEIRKVLLVRALANRPRLLILDNAFDGLDVPSREILSDLVSRTIQGFRVDILVQAVSAKATAHTQVLMITQRAEELVDEIVTITSLHSDGTLQTQTRTASTPNECLHRALQNDSDQAGHSSTSNFWDDDRGLPSLSEVAAVWKDRTVRATRPDILVQATHLCLKRDEAVLLRDLNWEVFPGQRWWVAGGNGQGKSTLSRMLAKYEAGVEPEAFFVALQGVEDHHRRLGVGWVSTELHLDTSRSSRSAREVLRGEDADVSTASMVTAVASWLSLDESLLSRPFSTLSQGQQKLVLIGAAVASRPDILVLDEPCQGLDLLHRNRVLGLVERICQATDLCLIYITHHPEEVIPSISHVLHLANGSPVYDGSVADYDPSALASKASATSELL